MKANNLVTALLLSLSLALPVWAEWQPKQPQQPSTMTGAVTKTIQAFKQADPGIQRFFNEAYGYAVFPNVGKGGIGIGGAYGKGQVYEAGRHIGQTSLIQLSIGFQLGGQAYSEILFFKDKTALDAYKSGNFELSAQASAIAVTAGASADAVFDGGIAVFTLGKGGLMYEASVAGQKFNFKAQ